MCTIGTLWKDPVFANTITVTAASTVADAGKQIVMELIMGLLIRLWVPTLMQVMNWDHGCCDRTQTRY
jgi:hypothetical protein